MAPAVHAEDAFAKALAETSREPSPCRAAEILFGPVSFDILPHKADFGDWESAIIRSASFEDRDKPSGTILGELTVDRGSFAIRTIQQEVVGVITTSLGIDGWDEQCATDKAEIVPVRDGSFIVLNDGRPVGTIEGRLPAHAFELELQ
jgi:hypothetical protein